VRAHMVSTVVAVFEFKLAEQAVRKRTFGVNRVLHNTRVNTIALEKDLARN
jgi:hypothetical protein